MFPNRYNTGGLHRRINILGSYIGELYEKIEELEERIEELEDKLENKQTPLI